MTRGVLEEAADLAEYLGENVEQGKQNRMAR